MAQNLTDAAPVRGDASDGGMSVAQGFQGQGRRKGLRGLFALGFLFLTAALSYGTVFVLIDKWYKGGSLGIL